MSKGRPLWQIVLTLLILGFTVQRGVLAAVFLLGGTDITVENAYLLVALHVLEVGAGLVTALGLWLGRRFVLGALLALGTTVVATALAEAFYVGIRSPFAAVSGSMATAVFTGILLMLLRYEFGASRDEPAAIHTSGHESSEEPRSETDPHRRSEFSSQGSS